MTLNGEFMTSFMSPESSSVTGIDELLDRLAQGEFDLVAIGRSLIVNPSWPAQVKRGTLHELLPLQRDVLTQLV